MSKFNNLAITTGYVESESLATLLVSHKEGFDTHKELFDSFCAALLAVYKDQHELIRKINQRGCCKVNKQKQPDAIYCSTCRTPLKDQEVTEDHLLQYTHELMGGTTDSMGGDAWECFDQLGWEVPGRLPIGKMLCVGNFRPTIAGQEDEELQSHMNELTFSSIGCDLGDQPAGDGNGKVTMYQVIGQTGQEYSQEYRGGEIMAAEEMAESDDEDEDDEYGRNPVDFLFALSKSDSFEDNDGWTASVCPIKYFQESGYMYDQHVSVNIPGWTCELEGVYSPDVAMTPEDMYAYLVSLGFQTNEAYTALFARDTEDREVYTPATGAIKCVPVPECPGYIGAVQCQVVRLPAMGKIDTEACKELIANLALFNPGLVAREFVPEPGKTSFSPAESLEMDRKAGNPKNWVRIHKQTNDKGNTERTFNCKPFDEQLRAVVEDDGTQIISVSIQGE